MARDFVCSSHTISGVAPGGPVASRHLFAARVAACAAAGYSGMCLHFRDYLANRAAGLSDAAMRDLLDKGGMRHRSVEFLADWFTMSAAARANEAAAFAAARAFGASVLNVGPDLGTGLTPPAVMRTAFRAVAARAEAQGLSLALEIVAWGNVRDVATALEIVEGIENAGVVVDIWHVMRAGIPLADIAAIPASRILAVQINDADPAEPADLAQDTLERRLCGEGGWDLAAFVGAVRRPGYAGPLSVEVISTALQRMDVAEAARRSLDAARKATARV